MPKLKISKKLFGLGSVFLSDGANLVKKRGFKIFSESFIRYIDHSPIFKLPQIRTDLANPPNQMREYFQKKLNSSAELKQITSNKIEKLGKEKKIILQLQTHLNVQEDKNFVTIAEIKKEYYYFLKVLRFISCYSIAPYNLLLFLHNFHFYSIDWFIFHLFLSNAALFLPYFLTEDWVTNISYDKAKNKLHITKINLLCKEYTTIHSPDKMVRIHRKNNLRLFSFFKNKSTNEHFSILHLCDIKDSDLLNKIIQEKQHTAKNDKNNKSKENNNNNISNNTAYFKYYLRIILLVYFSVFFVIVFYKIRQLKKENDLIIIE